LLYNYVAEDGTINRRELGGIVFADSHRLKKLNDIVWPEISRLAAERAQQVIFASFYYFSAILAGYRFLFANIKKINKTAVQFEVIRLANTQLCNNSKNHVQALELSTYR
jgi:dephospho-CoA kinase